MLIYPLFTYMNTRTAYDIKRTELLIFLILIVSISAVYSQVMHYGFISFDDYQYICTNHHVQKGITLETILWAFTSSHASNWHPITWLSHMMDVSLFGMQAGMHHLINVIFHLLNSILLFLVFRKTTDKVWQSLAVAVLFALHPVHVESVAWVSERKDVLSTFFWMLTMLAYVRYVRSANVKRYLFVLLFFSLGLMSKPMLVTLPFVLLLMDYWPLKRFTLDARNSRHVRSKLPFIHLVVEKMPLFILAATSSIITFLVQKSGKAVVTFADFSFGERFANVVTSYVGYIWKMIWPYNLAIYYPYPASFSTLNFTASILLLLIITIIIVKFCTTHPYLITGWFWYLGTLVPVIGLVKVGSQAMADRYTYVPFIGLFVITAWSIPNLIKKGKYRNQVVALSSICIVLCYLISSWIQVRYWKNSIELYKHALSVTENNVAVLNNLGIDLMKQKEFKQSLNYLKKAEKIDPNLSFIWINIGNTLMEMGQHDDALSYFFKAIEKESNNIGAYRKIGLTLQHLGQFDKAESYLKKAIQLDPGSAIGHADISLLYLNHGKMDKAINHIRKAYEVAPQYYEINYNYGLIMEKIGNTEKAMAHYYKTLEGNPDHVEAHINLGSILARKKMIQQALSHFSKAVHIQPDNAQAHNNLGTAFAASGKIEEAIMHYKRAIQINHRDADAHNNLGIAFYRMNDEKAALYQFRKALDISPGRKDIQNNISKVLSRSP